MLALWLACSGAMAQEAIFERRDQGSPRFNADGTVTLSLRAPEAQKVYVVGDCVEGQRAEMKKDGDRWSYTTGQLAPELYNYRFVVDGVEALDPSNIERSRDVRSFMSTFIVTKEVGDQGYLYGNHDVAHGNMAQVWYDSPQLGIQRRMSIYTPAGYDKGKNYPVLYLLHGAGGDEEAWPTLGRVQQIMDNLIALGKAEPMIVVMPNGNASDDASPLLSGLARKDRPKTSYEKSFDDIMKYVENHYKVKKDAASTAVCGLSMGGYHTFMISNLRPGRFNYIGLFSAAIRMGNDNRASLREQLANDPEANKMISSVFAAKPSLYWIAIGREDFLKDQNDTYRAYLDQKGYKYEYFESAGGHIWRNWRIYLSMFAPRLFK